MTSATGFNFVGTNAPFTLNAGTSSVQITQPTGQTTKLRTDLANVNYYPAVHIDNGGVAGGVNVSLPQIPYQNLTIINNGVSPPTSWVNFGASTGNVDAMYLNNANSELWVASGGIVQILNPTTLAPVGPSSISFSGSSSGSGTTKINCFWEGGGYMFIGGDFASVNGNAQAQFGITRINTSTYLEDPIYYSGSNQDYGIIGYVNTIAGGWGDIICGGLISSIAITGPPPGPTLSNAVRIQSPFNTSGSQYYDNISNQLLYNAEVFCSAWDGGTNNLFIGGAFTSAGPGLVATYNKFVAWNTSSNTNTACDGNNITSTIYNCSLSNTNGSFILAYGGSYIAYIEVSNPNNTATSAGVSPSSVSKINLMSCRNGKDTFATDNGDVYQTLSFAVWETLGQSNPGFNESGVIHTATGMIASYFNYTNLRENNPQSQAVSFSLPTANFKTSAGLFQTATLATPSTAQQFVSDSGGVYWYALGTPVCIFS